MLQIVSSVNGGVIKTKAQFGSVCLVSEILSLHIH